MKQAAVAMACRTLEYISNCGEPPEEMMDCDCEMWELAHAVLKAANLPIPQQQSDHRKWKAAIAKATEAA